MKRTLIIFFILIVHGSTICHLNQQFYQILCDIFMIRVSKGMPPGIFPAVISQKHVRSAALEITAGICISDGSAVMPW